jgi:hypothetical protein
MLGASTNRSALTSWLELQQRFGNGGPSNVVAFRRAFSRSLAAVGAACPMLRFTIGRNEVEVQSAVAFPAILVSEPTPLKLTAPETDTVSPGAPPTPVTVPAPMGGDVPTCCTAPATVPAVPTAKVMEAAIVEPDVRPRPSMVQASPRHTIAEAKPNPGQQHNEGRIRLAPRLTGLEQSVWLRRGEDPLNATFEVTLGGDYNPVRRSLLILEPMILQVQGSLQPRDLEQVAAWATANAELIQDYWDGSVVSASVITERVKRVTASRW